MRFIKFCLVGLTGVAINEGLLFILTEFFAIYYLISSAIAIGVAIQTNFFLHEIWTFVDRKHGRKIHRLLKYNLTTVGGGLINIIILALLTSLGFNYLIANIFGIAAGLVWNYNFSTKWAWKKGASLSKPIRAKASLIIPTYNEAGNIEKLIKDIAKIEHNLEIIVVDDNSPDGTADIAKSLAKKFNVKVLVRKSKKGLASAVLDGFKIAKGNVLGVMDADFSHPPEKIKQLLKAIESGYDVAIGSRYAGGSISNWSLKRKIISKIATLLAKPLTDVKDPMSGFFFLRRDVVCKKLEAKGFKILFEILVKCKPKAVIEIPYTFKDRKCGESKFDISEIFNYLKQCLSLYIWRLRHG